MRDSLLILNYDRLASRMAVRKLRAERVCCRIVPWDIDAEALRREDPSGLLLCAAADTPDLEITPQVLGYPGPVLALGAAAAALNAALGGQNSPYSPMTGLSDVSYSECPLLNGLPSGQRLLRGLSPMRLPEGAQVVATIGAERTAVGFSLGDARRFGMQVELEAHDPDSTRLLTNFALNICGCTPWWDEEAFVRGATDDIRQATGEGNAVCLMTGGLYSNVTALLAARALGDRLTCFAVDTGLLQDDEEDDFFAFFTERTGITVIREDHRERFLQALKGVREMSQHVDALLVISNEKLLEIYPDQSVATGFKHVDETLTTATKSIAELITCRGIINLDFRDVKKILSNGGVAIMSTGIASGENRVNQAFDAALKSPLLYNNDIHKSKKILFNIYQSTKAEYQLMLDEMNEVRHFMDKFEDKNIEVIWGLANDDTLNDEVKITVLATGFGMESIPMMEDEEETDRVIEDIYGDRVNKKQLYLYEMSDADLDNDALIDAIESSPSYLRNSVGLAEIKALRA